MKRRLFLQLPIAASFLTLIAQGKNIARVDEHKGFKVDAGKDRFNEALALFGGTFTRKVSSKDTNGDFCVYDTTRKEKGGPGLHFHHDQDEWFYVMKGEFLFQVGDQTFTLKAGDSAFGPRKIPHAFAKTSEDEGQMLITFQPAGTIETFFVEASKMSVGIPKDFQRDFTELSRKHGMEVVGPPLTYK